MITLRQLGGGTTRLWVLAIAVLMSGAILSAQPVAAQSPPGTTDSVTVTRADGTLSASWNAVDGATSYHVTYSSDGAVSWSLAAYKHTSTSITITGADNSKTYIVAVRARNSSGGGGWRNSAPAGPYTPPPTQPTPTPAPTPPADPPGTPSSVTVTRADGTLTATWPAVSGASKYHVTYSSDGKQSWTAASDNHTGTSITISANNGKTYIVAVRAGNAAGWSGWTNSPSAAPMTPPPAAPASVSVTRADGTLTASWDAVSGATGYHVTYSSDGKQSWSLAAYDQTATSIEISGADNSKTYYVAVRALNGQVGGPWTNSDAAGPFNPPAAPTGLSVTPGDGYYDVAWDAVTGATGYDVRAKASGSSTWHDAASNVTGTSYRYTTSQTLDHIGVRARNASGASAWTEISRAPSNEWLTTVQQFDGASVQSLSMASAQSEVSGQSKLSAPTWSAIDRDQGDIDLNWTHQGSATGFNLVCSDTDGWSWSVCGWDDDGTTSYTSVPSSETRPVTVTHDGPYELYYARHYTIAIRAVNADPTQASDWVNTQIIRPIFPMLTDFTWTRSDGQVTMSWTPNPWTTGYKFYCDNYTQGEAADYTLCATLTNQDDKASTHSVTITKSGGTHNWSALDDTSTLDIAIESSNATGEARWLAPLMPVAKTLAVSNIDVRTATLTVGNHTAQWWYKATSGPHTSCQGPVAANTATKDLTGLSANTSYTYKAYSAADCASANEIATATAFTTLSSVSNLTSTKGSYTGGINQSSSWAVAFTTGSNAGGYTLKSFTAPLKDENNPREVLGVALHAMKGTGDYSTDSEPASTALAGATLSGTNPSTIEWVDTTYTCSGSGCKLSPDTTYFVVLTNSEVPISYRWALAASAAAENEVALPSNNGWSIGYGHYTTGGNWVTYTTPDLALAGFVFETHPSLTSSNVTSSGATLTISNHTGNWYYKATTGPHTTCSSAQSGTTATLTGLTAGTAYTYTAYSDSGCTTANLLATAAAFTTPLAKTLTASNIGATTARLTVANHTAQWWYKANAAPHTSCQGPVAANTATKDLTGLSANTAYTYTAYSATGCSNANEIATAGAFTTLSSVSNLSSTKKGNSTLNSVITKQAVGFTTGSNAGGYVLKTVTLPLKNTSGSGGLTVTLQPMQGGGSYSYEKAPSSTILATLSGTAPTSSSYTNTTWTCSGSGCALSPNTAYFIVANRTASANYDWHHGSPETETRLPSDSGWDIRFAHDYLAGTWSSTSIDFNLAELVFAYKASLSASGVTTTGATLTIAQHAGDWYYKANLAPHATCQGPVSTTSVTLSSLTAGSSYTYKAYSDSGCTTANLLATAAAFTTTPTTTPAPSGLNLSFNSGLLKMQASWSKPSGVTGSVSYELQHADSDRNNPYGSTTTIAATSASTVTHTFNNSLTVKFRVRAVVNGVKSAWVEYVS